jgi:hypothetical protein
MSHSLSDVSTDQNTRAVLNLKVFLTHAVCVCVCEYPLNVFYVRTNIKHTVLFSVLFTYALLGFSITSEATDSLMCEKVTWNGGWPIARYTHRTIQPHAFLVHACVSKFRNSRSQCLKKNLRHKKAQTMRSLKSAVSVLCKIQDARVANCR